MHDLLPPPDKLPREPEKYVLPAGTVLYRVHDREYRADAFNARVEDTHFLGTRFGGTARDKYPTFYAALEPHTAIAESLLHDAKFMGDPVRVLTYDFVSSRLLSTMRLAADVTLVSLLDAPALSAVSATDWLVQCERDSYALTRRWGQWIRGQVPWAQGFVWPSKRQLNSNALMLMGDRVGEPARVDYRPVVEPLDEPVRDFAKDADLQWLNELLANYQATVIGY